MKLLRGTSGSRSEPPALALPPPAPVAEPPLPPRATQVALSLPRRRGFLLSVILPLLVAAVYYFGVAADQYVSEARFTIRNQDGGG